MVPQRPDEVRMMRSGPWMGGRLPHGWRSRPAWLLAAAVWVASATVAHAQAATGAAGAAAASTTATATAVPPAYDSPRSTMFTFLEAMHAVRDAEGEASRQKAWERALSCFDFTLTDRARGQEIAEKLLSVLDRIGEVRQEELPDAAMLEGSTATEHRYFPRLPEHEEVVHALQGQVPGRIALARQPDGRWLFGAGTTAGIEALYAAMVAMPERYQPTLGLVDTLGPTFRHTPWLGWAALLGGIFAGLALGKLIQAGLTSTATRLERHGATVRAVVFRGVANPLSLGLLSVGMVVGLRFLHLTQQLDAFTWSIVRFLLLLSLGWLLYNLVDVVDVWLRRITARTATRLDDMIVPLIRKSLRVFLVLVFSLVVAQNVFGLDITGWLAGLGIAGLAVSLAAQDSIKNLFGSVTVLFDRPFTVGDFIHFEGQDGVVEEIGFRSTRMRTLDGHLITVPNMKFTDNSVRSITARRSIRRVLDLTITYDTPPDKVEAAVRIVRELLARPEFAWAFDAQREPPRVGFADFAAAALVVRAIYWYQLADGRGWWSYTDFNHRVNLCILRAFEEAGIEFAFPTQTLYLAGDAKRPLNFGPHLGQD